MLIGGFYFVVTMGEASNIKKRGQQSLHSRRNRNGKVKSC